MEGNQEKLNVRVIGELVADGCSELRDAVTELASRRPKAIVLDLAQTTFVDTSGLGALVGLRTHVRRFGTELTVANPQPRVMQVFRLTQLSRLFGLEG